MYAALKGSGCDAMLRMSGRVVRETPLFVSPSAHLARLSDRLRRLKESFGQLGQQPWPRPAMPCCAILGPGSPAIDPDDGASR